ncbi:MAG: ATP-binding protein [Chloroflexi bacterium]|nr:ATP-binding protein [Chloroflexota bacterium]
MFCLNNDGVYERATPHAVSDMPAISRMPAGAYRVVNIEHGSVTFATLEPSAEPVFFLDTPEMRMVRREVEAFFDPATTARLLAAGLKHRRGIILHGPPGTGKTSMVRQLIPLLVERDAVILVDCRANHLERTIIPAIRRGDPDRPIVLFFDDLSTSAWSDSSEFLQLLDELTSPEHLLTIGCTSYFKAVPVELRNRPSLFGLTLRIRRLPDGVHERLAEQKYPTLSPADRQFAVRLTQDLPIDYLEEACKLFLMGYDPDEVRDRLHTTMLAGSVGRRRRR